MKRIVGQSVLIMLIFIIQNTIFSTLSFNGVKPNLLLIVTVFFGYKAGMNNGMLTGFLCGLLCDIFFGSYLGIYSLLFMLTGAFSGYLAKVFFADDIVFPYISITICDCIFGFVCYTFMFMLRGRFSFGTYVSTVIFPEILYTLIMSFALIPVLHRIHAFFVTLERKEKESDVSGDT